MTDDGLPNPYWPGTIEDRITGLQLPGANRRGSTVTALASSPT